VQQYLALPESRFGENTIADELALAERTQTFTGRWSDSGAGATLTAEADVVDGPLCRSGDELLMNGTITVWSDDERVQGLSLPGTRRIWVPSGDSVVGSREWSAGDRLECGAVDPWPFTTPACVLGRRGVWASYGDQAFEVLQIYVYDSTAFDEGGPADSVMSFSTEP
jgi:hypothetical protein